MDAKDYPVNQPAKEFESQDVKVRQRKPRNIDEFDGENESLVVVAEGLNGEAEDPKAYAKKLAFMEEWLQIQIYPEPGAKYPAKVVPVWVNGQGATILTDSGKKMVNGWLPIGVPVKTQRKFVEVLARAKSETVQTQVVKHEGHEENNALRYAQVKHPFSVIQDSPEGMEWLSKVLMNQ